MTSSCSAVRGSRLDAGNLPLTQATRTE